MAKTGPEAVAESELIKEVTGDDDLDMSTLGKPISSLKPVKAPEEAKEAKEAKPKKEKSSKSKDKHRATEALWSQLDKEIADVSDDEIDIPINLNAEPTSPITTTPTAQESSRPSEPRRGVIVGGLSGGTSLGANAPLKEGPKDHSYDIVDGEAKARVYDTPELRGAFLFYCKSSIKVSEMHLVHEGPFMAAQQFVQMCRDYKLLEPDGKLSFVMVGIIYTTSKSDDDEGLAFGQFLDSLVSLAFECETNVAGVVQAEWDKKDVLNKAKEQARPPRGRPQMRNLSAPGTAEDSGANTPGTGATTPGSDAPPGLSRCGTSSRFHEILDHEIGAPVMKKKEAKTRFQGVESMTQSSVLDKVNEVSKIKSMATSRATSVINSRVTSRMVSRLPSRRASEYGDDEDEEDDLAGDMPGAFPPAAASGYNISPSFLSTHVHAALEGYEGYEEGGEEGPNSPSHGRQASTMVGANGEPISPLFAVAGNIPGSPLNATASSAASRMRNSFSGGGAPSLRPTTANRLKTSSVTGAMEAPGGIKTLPKDLINKGFAEGLEGDDNQRTSSGGRPPVQRPGSNGSDASDRLQPKTSLKSALAKQSKLVVAAPPGVAEAAFGSPVGSIKTRFSASENGVLTNTASEPVSVAAAAAEAAVVQELPLLSPDLSKQINTQLWSEWSAQGGQGQPTKDWVAANVTKYTDGTAAASPALENVARKLTVQEGSVAITAKRKVKGAAAAAAAAAAGAPPVISPAEVAASLGRRDSMSGDTSTAGDKAMSPYELQLAKLEAKYKRGGAAPAGGADAAAAAAAAAAPGTEKAPRSGSARGSMSGGPVWRPAGKEGSLSASGKLNPDMARVASGRIGGRASSTGEKSSPKGNAGASNAANVLKSTLLTVPDGPLSGDGNPDSPTEHLHHLPSGEALSPHAAAAAAATANGARQPISFNPDQMAMMASFGQGVLEPPAPDGTGAPDADDESAGSDDKFAFVQKRRAEMEAKLAQIEQRFGPGGKPGELQKPKPPSGPPPGSSPRNSSTIAAVKKLAAVATTEG